MGRAVESADKAIEIKPSNAQAHLVARRFAAADGRRRARTRRCSVSLYADAREDYREFLDLTNFSTGLGSKLAFHFIGLGVGSRRHADRQGAYDSLRSAGFLGLCLSEQKVGNPLKARDYCKRALGHAPNDPIALFPARQRQPRSVQRAAVVRIPEGRAIELREDARAQPASRRIEEREELRRADRRLVAARRMRSLMTAGAVVAAIVLGWAGVVGATQPATLRVVVIEGEDAVNIIQQKTAVRPVVEVRDRNNLPVPGAIVTFSIEGGKAATFGGASTLTVATNAAGQAAVTGLTPSAAGAFQIQVSAAFQGQVATATIAQTNVMTAAQAAAASAASGEWIDGRQCGRRCRWRGRRRWWIVHDDDRGGGCSGGRRRGRGNASRRQG